MKTKRSKATDIPMSVKKRVWERDNGRCIVCGNSTNVMPNAHYLPRSKGGLGIEENIVTLCTLLTPNKCHHKFDNGSRVEREKIKKIIETYLKTKYPNWNEEIIKYKKGV